MYVQFDEDKEKEKIIKKFAENNLVLTSLGFERILINKIDPEEIIVEAKKEDQWLVSDEFIQEYIDGRRGESEKVEKENKRTRKEKTPETVVIEKKRHIVAKEIDSELVIHEETDVTGKSTCEGVIENFLEYFNSKYNNLKEILQRRQNLSGSVPIKFVRKSAERDNRVSIIAMIITKRESRRGYKFIDVEDPTGELSVMIPDNKRQLSGIYERLLPDEVVGITGRLHNDLFIADEIYQPELPIDNKTNSASEPVSVAFLSDIHVGSYLFLEKEFNKFIDCLNLRGNNRELFERVKYLLIAGDLVDGIGIYPNQEEELSIPDIYRQYDFFALLLERIPDYIEIVLCMGNHDAVRNGEPQPRLSKDIGASLYALPNVHVLGNPVMVSIHGVKTLMYHGTSIDTMIGSLAECTYSRPEIAMVEYLKRRHLVPMYGNDSISPEREDYLAIKEIPDILHCGHVHTNGYANYRGVKVINSGTFQARTKYQEEQGHIPTPGRVPIMNLQNHEVSIVHFG